MRGFTGGFHLLRGCIYSLARHSLSSCTRVIDFKKKKKGLTIPTMPSEKRGGKGKGKQGSHDHGRQDTPPPPKQQATPPSTSISLVVGGVQQRKETEKEKAQVGF